MDWFSAWEPVPLIEVEAVDAPADAAQLTVWLIFAAIAMVAFLIWYRQRPVRREFLCATVERDVDVRFRRGCVLSCSAFEDPTAVACARRCLDRSFRVQWPPTVPVLTQRQTITPLA